MKRVLLIVTFLGVFGLLAACSTGQAEPKIQTTPDKLTFVFFYTDN